MKKFTFAALAALVAAASVANARDDEPSPEAIREYASDYMRQFSQQKMSLGETAMLLTGDGISGVGALWVRCQTLFLLNAELVAAG